MSQYPPPGQYGNYPPGSYPPPPPGNYGPPGGQYWQESPKSKGLAITALVLGILAVIGSVTVVGGILFGLFAAIFGLIAMVKARNGTAGGLGMGVAGLILGIVGIIISILLAVFAYSWFVDNGGKDLVDCLNKAGNDQAKIDQCQNDFKTTISDKYGITVTPEPTP
ncbi:DUF4190 domain-containing protein [Nocardia sp. NPDC020380]|uniref:DUF4190 domain-containing protein n=1 Tax=Nocardia sp. NPDC020380 TaxID=3364309 RepID=UPI0037B3C9F3